MELQSSQLVNNTSHSIDELLAIAGAVRSILVISAYTDIYTIDRLISFARTAHDNRTLPTLRVYIDYSSSGFTTNPEIETALKRCALRIERYCDEDSGIYLVRTGGLFHSKCYLVQGNLEQRLIVGSMNATHKGLTENEELVFNGVSRIGANGYVGHMIEWVNQVYVPRLTERSDKITQQSEIYHYPTTMRQLLLDGWLYYETKEQDPFRFTLNLPEEILESRAALHPMLPATIVDAVSVVDLITGEIENGGLGHSFREKGKSKESWRRYCVETCYGFWSPSWYEDEIEQILKNRFDAREPYYSDLKDYLENNKEKVSTQFKAFSEQLRNHITRDFHQAKWDAYDGGRLMESWLKWYDTMLRKLSNEQHYFRMVLGISWASVPDVWSDPIATDEFQNSFLESLRYYWSKSYAMKTSKVAACAIASNLEIDMQDADDIENARLKSRIERWCRKNRSHSIFESARRAQ
ncbi:phospholipase D family protein [uncultured Thiodictyon sp.]|uniref:phospholipase D family protein n=1 Tax=uncultured Thiodictyon sp. TaxID=1846217 RepID=UPI0025DE720E|nr:phospholipase D family protein [uncultured Thiodictyon sp.]